MTPEEIFFSALAPAEESLDRKLKELQDQRVAARREEEVLRKERRERARALEDADRKRRQKLADDATKREEMLADAKTQRDQTLADRRSLAANQAARAGVKFDDKDTTETLSRKMGVKAREKELYDQKFEASVLGAGMGVGEFDDLMSLDLDEIKIAIDRFDDNQFLRSPIVQEVLSEQEDLPQDVRDAIANGYDIDPAQAKRLRQTYGPLIEQRSKDKADDLIRNSPDGKNAQQLYNQLYTDVMSTTGMDFTQGMMEAQAADPSGRNHRLAAAAVLGSGQLDGILTTDEQKNLFVNNPSGFLDENKRIAANLKQGDALTAAKALMDYTKAQQGETSDLDRAYINAMIRASDARAVGLSDQNKLQMQEKINQLRYLESNFKIRPIDAMFQGQAPQAQAPPVSGDPFRDLVNQPVPMEPGDPGVGVPAAPAAPVTPTAPAPMSQIEAIKSVLGDAALSMTPNEAREEAIRVLQLRNRNLGTDIGQATTGQREVLYNPVIAPSMPYVPFQNYKQTQMQPLTIGEREELEGKLPTMRSSLADNENILKILQAAPLNTTQPTP